MIETDHIIASCRYKWGNVENLQDVAWQLNCSSGGCPGIPVFVCRCVFGLFWTVLFFCISPSMIAFAVQDCRNASGDVYDVDTS